MTSGDLNRKPKPNQLMCYVAKSRDSMRPPIHITEDTGICNVPSKPFCLFNQPLMPTQTYLLNAQDFPPPQTPGCMRYIVNGKTYVAECPGQNECVVDKASRQAGEYTPSAVLLALLTLILQLLRLVLPHGDDHVGDEHDVGHDGGRGAREGRVACDRISCLALWLGGCAC